MIIRSGDIIAYQIAGIDAHGFSGGGMVINANVIEKHLIDDDVFTGRVIVKNPDIERLQEFGSEFVTKIVRRREDIENFWEYL